MAYASKRLDYVFVGATKPRRLREKFADAYMNSQSAKERLSISNELSMMIKRYANVLSDKDMSAARVLYWGTTSMEEIRRKFMHLLTETYHVYDETHARYKSLLEAIRVNNPEWIEVVKRDHELKLKRARVVYPLSAD